MQRERQAYCHRQYARPVTFVCPAATLSVIFLGTVAGIILGTVLAAVLRIIASAVLRTILAVVTRIVLRVILVVVRIVHFGFSPSIIFPESRFFFP